MSIAHAVSWIVDRSRAFAWALIPALLLLATFCGNYAATHFAITTDVTSLLDASAPWRQREIEFSKAFPQRDDLLVVLIDGKNAADTELAAESLVAAMKTKPDLFRTVSRPDADPYLLRNGLLLMEPDDLAPILDGLAKAQPLIGTLAADPSPRGLFDMMNLMLQGVAADQVKPADLAPLFGRVSQALSKAIDDPTNKHAWDYLMASENPSKFELRRFILVQPVLDYSALAPGEKANDYIRAAAAEQKLASRYNVNIRLTGSVALSDEEFASVAEGMSVALIGSIILIALILYFTLRTWRIIIPIFITLFAGLAITTALALVMVKSLNLISVAFAVMFTGIAVDFGIQFGVRYRDARLEVRDLAGAMRRAATLIAVPLLLAALSTACGFFSFIPTSYRGVAELGLIAGSGMLIAFVLNITLLPALLRFTQPGPEREAVGFKWTKPVDEYLVQNRTTILRVFAVAFIGCSILCIFLPFDFDPLNLKNRKSESVAAMFELMADKDTTPYSIDILAENEAAAEALADKLSALKEVDKVLTLKSYVPAQQEDKIALLKDTGSLLATSFAMPAKPAPTMPEAQHSAAELLNKMSAAPPLGPEAAALADQLARFAKLDDANYKLLAENMRDAIAAKLADIKERLDPQPVNMDQISETLRSEWIAPTGQARLEVYPKGDAHDRNTLRAFVAAVKNIAPGATGVPVSIQESAATIKGAFIEAAIYSVVLILGLLLILLRSLRHAFFVLAPLLIATALTLGTITLFNFPINLANIISLPLLLGLGVSYSIYFVVFWLQGYDQPLQSGMARAVLASAATALVAFGSLSLSNHPGTASMGLLLSLSLFYVLFTTFLFLPALLGKPVNKVQNKGIANPF